MNEKDAKTAVMILGFMRLSGVAFVFFGLAVVLGKVNLPAVFGAGLVVLGVVEGMVLPAVLLRKWKSRG